MPDPQLFINVTIPPLGVGVVPIVDRTFQVKGTISWLFVPSNWSLSAKHVTVGFGPGGQSVAATFSPATNNWQCTGTVSPSQPWSSMFPITLSASATFRFLLVPGEPDERTLNVSTTLMVRLMPAFPPIVTIASFTSPIVAPQLPLDVTFTGSATSPQAPIQLVQYKVENGSFASAVNVSGNWSAWSVSLPLPPSAPGKDHVLTVRATDSFGTFTEVTRSFGVQPQTPIVIPPDARTTLVGAPTTSSVTSWTRLEPQIAGADMGTSTGARIFDPLWLMTRQWQMGEFQAEDAGTPIQARVRASCATLSRALFGELPRPAGGGRVPTAAPAYDPTRAPLEPLVERRRMRAATAADPRMLTFAVDAGLHFLRMLEAQPISKSYRAAFITRLALEMPSAPTDEPTARYLASMVGRAPDGRKLADLLRAGGAAPLVADPTLNIAAGDRAEVQQAAIDWLAWYDALCSEPTVAADDGWNPSRLEYNVAVGARLSASAADDMTFAAGEIDGPIDWSSFDVDAQAMLTVDADKTFASLVEATVPAPVSFPGAPAPRFWEMEDARIAYGLVPVGPTDIVHLMMIEYASSYGNDWYVVPLTVPIGSITRVDSLVVTDTFGVRSLLRPIGDPALPAPHFSLWQSSIRNPPAGAPAIAVNRLFLPPTLGRGLDGAPLEDVLFMRDEMANLAWAIERTVESPIEQASPRTQADGGAPAAPVALPDLPRYVLASSVPPNWIPLLPVQWPNPQPPGASTAGQVLSRLQRGAVLQTDGTPTIHAAVGQVLNAGARLVIYDEEVPREGVHVTKQRRLARWIDGSTWFWTSFRNQVGSGEGSSGLVFDRIVEPTGD